MRLGITFSSECTSIEDSECLLCKVSLPCSLACSAHRLWNERVRQNQTAFRRQSQNWCKLKSLWERSGETVPPKTLSRLSLSCVRRNRPSLCPYSPLVSPPKQVPAYSAAIRAASGDWHLRICFRFREACPDNVYCSSFILSLLYHNICEMSIVIFKFL